MKQNDIELTILMPCLDEEATIGKCIKKAARFIVAHQIKAEILIADNGSTDQSAAIAKELGANVVRAKERGYGNTLMAGIEAAKGKFIIMGDSDCSYDFEALAPFVEKLREGADLVMGNRFRGGIQKGSMPFLHRYFGNTVLSFIGRLFFKIDIGDFHCGLRGIKRESILEIGLYTGGMEFASEMIVKASLYKLNISEVPTKLYPDQRTRPPHLRTWHDGWRHLQFLLIYSPRWLFLYPGMLMILLGLLFSLILSVRQINAGNIHFDIHTLLYTMVFLFIGYQFILFYVFSKALAISKNLLPASKMLHNFFKRFNATKSILVGALVFMLGILLSLKLFLIWRATAYGNLNTTQTLRLALPAAFLLILGSQTIISSFFLSIIQIKSRNQKLK